MFTEKNVWLNARKYKPTDIEGYRCGHFLALRIEYPRYHEFDVVAGWYNTVRNRFEIPERDIQTINIILSKHSVYYLIMRKEAKNDIS